MRLVSHPIVAALAWLLFAAPVHGEPIAFFQLEDVDYDTSIPTPEQAFGFEIGERPVRHDQMVAYLTDLADRSDRISVETIGYSHERRPILFFTITAPDHQANIDSIRDAHLARRLGEAPADAAPMVLWLNYGVHGAEASGMDAAIPLLYHFAAAQGPEIEAMLDNAVILVTAIFNPDGHTRRIDHVNTFWSQTRVTNIEHAQHDLWIEARINHYWFDLNRQWLLLTQPEPQAWVAKWHEWKPMVSADYHEMGSDSPFYFHPGEALRRNPLIPELARDLTFQIGEHHAEWLDSEARLYTTQEGFDNFYIGKGSTYPQVNGSLGILFEIGAARGGVVETERGLVTHADNVRTQFRTSLTTIEGSLNLRSQITNYQRSFFGNAAGLAARDGRGAYVFTAEGDPERAARFVRLLRQHDIDTYHLSRDFVAGGRTYSAQTAYIVPMRQDQYRMIRGVFDQVTEFEEDVFYDVSGWTLPLAYDLDYAALPAGTFSRGLLGELATGVLTPPSPPAEGRYGYAFSWSDTHAPQALYRLLDAGLFARVAREPFSARTVAGEVSFERGAVFIPLMLQDKSPAEIFALVTEVAAQAQITVHAVESGLTPEDGRDLGARNVFPVVRRPSVLLVFDDGVSRYDAGELWWTLDQRLHMPVTLRRKDALGGISWGEYTHILLPGGASAVDATTTERLGRWIREEGGTLIAMTDGAVWAQREILGVEDEEAEAESETASEPLRLDYASLDVRDAEDVIGGALFATDVDITAPLGFGLSDRMLPVMRNSTDTLARPEGNPFAVIAQYEADPLLSGYVSQRRLDEIAGTPAVIAQRLGRGSVVLMADNPVFRGTFPGSERLLVNALFYSGLLQRPSGSYED